MGFFNSDSVVKTSGASNGPVNTTLRRPISPSDYFWRRGEHLDIAYTIRSTDHDGASRTQVGQK